MGSSPDPGKRLSRSTVMQMLATSPGLPFGFGGAQVMVKMADGGTSVNETPKEYATCGDDLCSMRERSSRLVHFPLGAFLSGMEGPELREERGELVLWHPCYLSYCV